MFKVRIRKDGVREARDDSEVYEIPHDHEIAPNACFAIACRKAYFINPKFVSVSSSDMMYGDALIGCAAIRDLIAIRDRLPDTAEGVDLAIAEVKRALARFPSECIAEAEKSLKQITAVVVVPSVGAEFEDAVWLAGTSLIEDQAYISRVEESELQEEFDEFCREEF